VKLIAGSRLKTDKVDAKALAQLLRTGFLPEAYLAPREVREYREILRYRVSLVKIRTMVKNRVHGILIHLNVQIKATDIFGKKGRQMLKALEIKEPERTLLDGWLDLLDFLNKQIKGIEQIMFRLVADDNRVSFLKTLPGVGVLTAYTIIAEMGEIDRFLSAKHFASYCGLVPSTRQSASITRHGRIGAGRSTLKWVIVEACHTAVRRDSYFGTIFNKHRRAKGNGKALIIIAHEMATIIYKMLKEKRGYKVRLKQNNKTKVGPSSVVASNVKN
jgi:transposase